MNVRQRKLVLQKLNCKQLQDLARQGGFILRGITTKKKLLQFATSNSRPPINGFKDLNPKFTIRPIYIDVNVSVSSTFKSIFSKKPTKDPLPSSATCFNMLKLPMYSNKKIMKQKLYKCIQEAKGFHIA
mmetsp:Transcript_22720/g.27976  ORF Transcript_22720/g.27976 Transcript_22720/m.27976 type:complete len:129 (+) Transcript_22720:1-387(+)